MSQDLPIPRQEDRADDVTVLEWGPPTPAPAGRFGRWTAGLGRDRRLPRVVAALGAVAATASLVGEWLVMTVPNGGRDGQSTLRVPGGVAEIGGFGVAYLVGLLLLVGTVALALAGRPGVRHDARVAGLAGAGALLVLLTATAFALDDGGQRALFYSPEDGLRVEYGRGLVMAFVATALLGVALLLARRQPVDPTDDPDLAGAPRPTPVRERDDRPPAPADLTVTATVPFARREPDR